MSIVLHKFSFRTLLIAPLLPVLYPLIVRNFRKREAGLIPDEWYWADMVICWGGFGVLTWANL